MDQGHDKPAELAGELIAELLDEEEYPSKIGNVAAVSDREILYLARVRHELVHFRYEIHDMDECSAVVYREERAWYRVVVAASSVALAAVLAYLLATGRHGGEENVTPLVIGAIASIAMGIRFATSTHRHIIEFQMPDRVLSWRSPAIDYRSRAAAAGAVRAFARERGILREGAG